MTRFGLCLVSTVVAAILFLDGGTVRAADYALVTGTDYAPYADSGQPGGGLAVRVVEGAFAAMGKTVAVTTLPWTRGYQLTLDGKFDATFPYVPSTARAGEMLYSDPIFMIEDRLYSAQARPILHIAQLEPGGKRYCAPIGYAPPLQLQRLIDNNYVVMFRPGNMALCIRMIGGGHADFIAADPRVVHLLLDGTGVKLMQGDAVANALPLMLMAPKPNAKSQAMIEDFNAGLSKIKADGTYARLTRFGS